MSASTLFEDYDTGQTIGSVYAVSNRPAPSNSSGKSNWCPIRKAKGLNCLIQIIWQMNEIKMVNVVSI